MEREYLQYKDRFRKYCNLKICACVAGVVTILLLIFLPLFKWTNELLGLFLEENEMRFSLFDEFKLAIEALKGEDGSHFLLEEFLSENVSEPYFPCILVGLGFLFCLVYIIGLGGVIWKAYQGLNDIDGYTVEEYDKILWHTAKRNPLNGIRIDAPGSAVVASCMFFAAYAIGLNLLRERLADASVSYFTFDAIGATWTVALLAIGVVITVGLEIIADGTYRSIQRDVLKKVYEKV